MEYLYQKAEILFPWNDKSDFTAVNHFDDVQLRSIKIIYCLYLSLFTNKAVLYFFDKMPRMALSWINQTLILETKRPSAKTGWDKARTANMLLKVSAWLPWWPKKPTKTRVAFVTGGGFALPHKQSECILHRGVFVCFATCVFAYFMRPPLVW